MSTDDTALSTTGVVATPRRTPLHTLANLFRTPTVSLSIKRARNSTPLSYSSTPNANTPSSGLPLRTSSGLPPVVLQTYSLSTDSIVLTALPSIPFCCHEDLLTMPRAQLEGVVRALNQRLPRCMRIGPDPDPERDVDFWNEGVAEQDNDDVEEVDDDGLSRMSEAEMRRRIEELVGIRAVVGKNRVSRSGLGLSARTSMRARTRTHDRGRSWVPPAPKAVRTRDAGWRLYEKNPWEDTNMNLDEEDEMEEAGEDDLDLGGTIEDALMGSSPLAARTKFGTHARGRNGALSRLAILREESEGVESKDEEDEGEEDVADDEARPSKRQKVALGTVAEARSWIVEEIRQSRLVENMDVSGSRLLVDQDDAMLDKDRLAASNEQDPAITTNGEASKENIQAPLQRRRSARIQEIALKRVSSVDGGKKTTLAGKNLRSSLLRSKTFSPSPTMTEDCIGADTPQEVTIRLPFASASSVKTDSSPWSAPRILRSHSQRLLRARRSKGSDTSLSRTQSDKLPRATNMDFVTIERPRYRFARRKSKGSKNLELHRSSPDLLGQREEEKENENPNGKVVVEDMLRLVPRSRAPSTSTSVASTRGYGSDSPARILAKEDAAAVGVSEALERMVVDGFE